MKRKKKWFRQQTVDCWKSVSGGAGAVVDVRCKLKEMRQVLSK